MKGKLFKNEIFCCGAIFVDCAKKANFLELDLFDFQQENIAIAFERKFQR